MAARHPRWRPPRGAARFVVWAACALVLLTAASAAAPYATLGGLTPDAASPSGFAYAVDADALAARWACFPNLGALVAAPSAVLTDYYGLQALNGSVAGNVSGAAAAAAGWTVVSSSPAVTRIALTANVTADFYAGDTPLALGTQYAGSNASVLTGTTFAEVLVTNPCDFLDAVAALRAALAASAPAFLPANPYYAAEGVTALLLALTASWGNNITTVPSVDAFAGLPPTLPNATLLIEDTFPLHPPPVVTAMLAAIASPNVSWVALQALPSTAQADLNTYLTAPSGSGAWAAAEAALQNAAPPGYFQFVSAARHAGIKRAAAMDTPPFYGVYRYGVYYFASGVRNILWAAACGADGGGRGVMLASGSHFSPALAPLFEAALAIDAPSSALFLLSPPPPPPAPFWMYQYWWAVLLMTVAAAILLFVFAVYLFLRSPHDPAADDPAFRYTTRSFADSSSAAYKALPS